MARIWLNSRLWVLTAFIFIGISFCMGTATAAGSTSYIQVSSDPSGALACLDHYNCQETPVTFSTTFNSYHSVTVYQDGYQMSTQTVLAGDSGATTTINMTLTTGSTQTGIFNLDSNPSNADIWVDGRYYGTTPQTIGGLSAGTHNLTLREAGYFDYTEFFAIIAGQTTIESPAMTPYSVSSGFGDL